MARGTLQRITELLWCVPRLRSATADIYLPLYRLLIPQIRAGATACMLHTVTPIETIYVLLQAGHINTALLLYADHTPKT